MVHVDTGRFLNELGRLFEKAKAKDSVWITLKRSNLKPRKSRKPNEDAQYVCLVRATDGKKKISTTVTAKDFSRFQESYATILKVIDGAAPLVLLRQDLTITISHQNQHLLLLEAHMDALKRREKTKAKPSTKKT